ncbi:ATP-binding cassette domain-containing protein [Spirulina major CS-329]|uniref:energy-coupling factor ABC transporter ATP-binding protein n=1 Tax=Spirulina TaxID=1154 RepID=UPI00232E214E|nr:MULTISPECIES: ATP-binding cassette domain-containing protein [Spirulina]MDB9494540.1 ATP-binding cassette domain-containing protein [Spirulina subsalsa CS-330]MDB9502941.1 ATP-binding cassette domain-containing protein [Spirulina major CS-329]
MNQPVLRSQDLSITTILTDISFTVAAGDRIGIVGASGSGKSTLLALFNRLRDPDQGQLWFQGQPLATIPVSELRRKVVLVLQEPKLLGLSVFDTLAYPLTLQKRPKTEVRERVFQECDRFNIPNDWLERQSWQLSLGQRQLVTIARAMLLNPTLLLLDEPTSALDVGTASRVLQVLTATPGLTWIMANHQLDWVQQSCDRVWYLYQGKLWADTTVSEINWPQIQDDLKTQADDWDDLDRPDQPAPQSPQNG